MDLSPYLSSVRSGLEDAAALADDQTRQIAGRLAAPLDAVTRLALVQALADAAAEISVELAPGSVALQVQGSEPVFVVDLPHPAPADDVRLLEPDDEADLPDPSGEGDEPQARVSLRLPQSVKARVDEYADAEGVSTNTWLVQRVLEALAQRTRGRGRGGWGIDVGRDGVRLEVPPSVPPLPPLPRPFRPDPPSAGPEGGERRRPDRGRPDSSGSVQGWVR